MRFAISTHLFHDVVLSRDHLSDIAAQGFEAIELFATRTHFDYHDPASIERLAGWLSETGLRLHSVHAPIAEGFVNGIWGPGLSLASADRERRARALAETEAALGIARVVRFEFLVLHLGTPDAYATPGDNSPESARRSVEDLHALAAPLGVRLALELIPNELSSVPALRRLLDDELELRDAGICLDTGHAHLMEDAVSAVEEASGHLFTTHVHDNRGRDDDHLVPFDGEIDWPRVVFALQKVGYEGPLVFEVAGGASAAATLERTRGVCRRFEDILKY